MNTTLFGTPTIPNLELRPITNQLFNYIQQNVVAVKDKTMNGIASTIRWSSKQKRKRRRQQEQNNQSNPPYTDKKNDTTVHTVVLEENQQRNVVQQLPQQQYENDTIVGTVRLLNHVDAPNCTNNISNIVALGAGCYWGTEKFIKYHFQNKYPHSIQDCSVGFMSIPTEQMVPLSPALTTKDGTMQRNKSRVEVLYIELVDPVQHYEKLIRFFFQFHDPTTLNRQGNDKGYQYSSCIFCDDIHQYHIAQQVYNELQSALNQWTILCYSGSKLTTQIIVVNDTTNHNNRAERIIVDVSEDHHGTIRSDNNDETKKRKWQKYFMAANEDHQGYLLKNPNGYCNHRIRFRAWPTPL